MNPKQLLGAVTKAVPKMAGAIGAQARRYAPQLIFGVGVGCVAYGAYELYKTGKKVQEIETDPEFDHALMMHYQASYEESNDERKATRSTDLYKARLIGKNYILPVSLMAGGVGLLSTAFFMQWRRTAQAISAAAAAEAVVATYNSGIVETLTEGSKTAQTAVEKQDERTFEDAADRASAEYDFLPGSGGQIFLDGVTGFAFRCDESLIREMEQFINEQINDGEIVCLFDAYEKINVEYFGMMGSLIGWSPHTKPPHFTFGAKYVKNGHPVNVLHYNACVVDGDGLPFEGTEIHNTVGGLFHGI